MTKALDDLARLNEQVAELRTQQREVAKSMVHDGTKSIFAEYGDVVHSFGWAQYTPYFNDGDPCTFGMNGLWVYAVEDVKGVEDEDQLYDLLHEWKYDYEGSPAFGYSDSKYRKTTGYGRNELPNPNYDPRYGEAYEACQAIYSALSDNDLALDLFGDHVEVTFSAEGVDVEEHDHD